jgi:hypothetical protein
MIIKNDTKKIEVGMSLLVDRKKVVLELRDKKSCIVFLHAEFSSDDFCSALSRLCDVPITCEVNGLNLIGKKMIMHTLTFPLPPGSGYNTEVAKKEESKYVPEGWRADEHFGSRGSFTSEEGTTFAHDIIRKWVEE